MTARERLQKTYELAFDPPSLFAFWRKCRQGDDDGLREAVKLLDDALLLHQALPASGYASQRALTRLALYQARARAFGLVGRIESYRQKLGLAPLAAHVIPAGMVRDIALPPLARRRPRGPALFT
jgi:hypothetical protein